MIQFVSITSFRKRLAALLKVKRGVYAGVETEICQAFKDATIEQIRQNRDMILMNNDAVVIKGQRDQPACDGVYFRTECRQTNVT